VRVKSARPTRMSSYPVSSRAELKYGRRLESSYGGDGDAH